MNESTITVKEFVDKYNGLSDSGKREAYVQSIIKTTYLSYAMKELLAKKIIEQTSFERDENLHLTNRFKVNSIQRYVTYVYTVVSNYTIIKMNNDDIITDFDELDKHGLVDVIIAALPEAEIKKFDTVINMARDDFMTNYYETHAYISKQVDKVVEGIKEIGEAILPEIVKELDAQDLKVLLEALKKLNK